MKNFWLKLNKSFYGLAPMAGLTDSAFRQIGKDFGADFVYSEMASATALVYSPAKTLGMLKFSEKERPYVVQLFGAKPEHFAQATKIVAKKIKPDGIDINFGCPVKKVLKQGAGAGLMDNLSLAHDVVKAVCDNTDLPVSIKMRAKGKKHDCLELLEKLSDLPVAAVMIHGRTLAQGFSGEVDTAIIKKARDYFGGVILANGGVRSADDAHALLAATQADGIGIGRGATGKPWIFSEIKSLKLKVKSYDAVIKIIIRHAKLAEKLKGERGIVEMRGHLCHYVSGFANAKHLREMLVRVKSAEEIEKILNKESAITPIRKFNKF